MVTEPEARDGAPAARAQLALEPVGWVTDGRMPNDRGGVEGQVSEIEVEPRYVEALDGVEAFSHLWIVWWFDQASGPLALQVHPEKRTDMPLLGVFATRSPRRPNPLAITAVRLLDRCGARLRVVGLDAYRGTPILDIKPYLRRGDLIPEANAPEWLERLWSTHDGKQEGR